MKIRNILPVAFGAALIFAGGNAWGALTTCLSGSTNPGQDVCTGDEPDYNPALAQDNEANVLTVINDNLLGGVDLLTSLNGVGKNEEGLGGDGTISNVSADGTSGEWSFTSGVDFVSVKADGSFKVFDVMGADSGTWDTFGILNGGNNTPEWSHLSFWTTDPGSEVPLPAAAWLFISGLGALGVLRRQQAA